MPLQHASLCESTSLLNTQTEDVNSSNLSGKHGDMRLRASSTNAAKFILQEANLYLNSRSYTVVEELTLH